MSLAIDIEKVTEVLIGNQWYKVDKKSMTIDSYEFMEYPDGYDHKKGWHQKDKYGEVLTPFVLHGGGNNEVCASGFSFLNDGVIIMGPLTSILAIRYK